MSECCSMSPTESRKQNKCNDRSIPNKPHSKLHTILAMHSPSSVFDAELLDSRDEMKENTVVREGALSG